MALCVENYIAFAVFAITNVLNLLIKSHRVSVYKLSSRIHGLYLSCFDGAQFNMINGISIVLRRSKK